MRIAVIGTGYVGLVTGAGFANTGLQVTCVDIDEEKIRMLQAAQVPFYEPGLGELISRNVEEKRLSFTSNLSQAVVGCDVVFLAVGTPMSGDGSADLNMLLTAAKQVAEAALGPLVLVTKSTVPVGTADRIRALVKEHSSHRILVASNPEFLKEGDAVNDFLKPERIIIGVDEEEAKDLLEKVYRPFMMREYRLIVMSCRSAELTKYAANGMLATRISFMNEMANLCERVGGDIDDVRRGISTDGRIGKAFLYPGVGYGGSCFPKDVRALIHTAEENECGLKILQAVDQVNNLQRQIMLKKIQSVFGEDLTGKTIAVWGLAFKPRTDDVREAPSIELIQGLLKAGAQVRAYDRAALANARKIVGKDVVMVEDEYAAIDGADALVLMTEWAEFRLPNWNEVKKRMSGKWIFDGRNIYEPSEIQANGFFYEGIGRLRRGN